MATQLAIIAWLKRGLAQSGMSQAELGRQIGQRRDVITHVLKGRRRLKGDEMIKIAEVLRIEPPNSGPSYDEGDENGPVVEMVQRPNGMAHIRIDRVVPWDVALKILALIEPALTD